MAKKKSDKPQKEEGEKVELTPFTQIQDIIKTCEHQHYGILSGDDFTNYEDEYISTGSARMDALFGGGFRPGISLAFGDAETGKTAQGLVWGKNWQDKYGDKGWVVYLDAEGRGTKYKIAQSGIDFNRLIWIRGNIGENIFTQIDKLVCNNKLGIRYFFLLDSADAMIRKEDNEKSFTDTQKVAGGAALQSLAGKKLSNPIHGLGHHLYMISQMRTQSIGGMGGKGDGAKPSGGKAPQFYADVIMRMYKGWTDTFIKDGDKIIGNKTKIKLTKSYNEISNSEIDLPIKYRHVGGIWKEYEAFLMAMEWGWLEKSGSWFKFTEMFQNFLDQDGIPIKVVEIEEVDGKKTIDHLVSLQGEIKVINFFEKMPDLVSYMESKVKVLSA